VLADYERRAASPRQLKRALSIEKPYVLLDPDEVKEFEKARMLGNRGLVSDSRFWGVTDLFSLSDVYFNKPRTLALTFISSWCGGLCAKYEWRVFEKLGTGKWEERPWTTCTTVSETTPPRPSAAGPFAP
jgi:hypothetical protein